MARKRFYADHIEFVVEYEDGKTATMWIDRWTLNRGDHVAPMIARDRQTKGDLPEGAIKSVKRFRA